MPLLFPWLQREGKLADAEMHRAFNCGIGMALVVAAEDVDATVRALSGAGETVFRIGRIEARKAAEPQASIG
jgi:phosphoribosylformylglycinamidine cyclo-ligase